MRWFRKIICRWWGHIWLNRHDNPYHRDCVYCGKHEMLFTEKYPRSYWR